MDRLVHEGDLPQLIIGTYLRDRDPRRVNYEFVAPLEGRYIEHQTAGFACSQRAFYAVLAPVTDAMQEIMVQIADAYKDSSFGMMSKPSISQLEEYRALLQSFRLDCNENYTPLEEAVYPLDLEPLLSAHVLADPFLLGHAPRDWIKTEFGLGRPLDAFILSQNSD